MSNRPFIIKNKVMETMVPVDSQIYDETQQSRIQIVQAINGYLTINMFYEAFKLMWSFWHYKVQCPDYAFLSLGFMVLNIIWGLSSYWGFSSIRSKSSRNVTIFSYILIGNLVLRIIMYIISGIVMKGYVPNYFDISQKEKLNVLCKAVYPQSLVIIQGILETLVCLFILFVTRSIIVYVRKWETHQNQKYIPKR